MKTFLITLLATAVMTFTGCSKDNNNDDNNSSESIIGKWERVSDHHLINGNWVLDNTSNPNEYALEFTSDGKVNQYNYGVKTITATYSYNTSKKELSIMGLIGQVEKLTSTELVTVTKSIDVNPITVKTTYKKVN